MSAQEILTRELTFVSSKLQKEIRSLHGAANTLEKFGLKQDWSRIADTEKVIENAIEKVHDLIDTMPAA